MTNSLIEAWCNADLNIVADPMVQQVFLADLDEVLIRGGGVESLVWEMQLYFRWGFRLENLPPMTRVLFWHGNDDRFVPACMTRHMVSRIPNSEAIYLPGGHFLAVQIVSDVLACLGHAIRSPDSLAQRLDALQPLARPVLSPLPGCATN